MTLQQKKMPDTCVTGSMMIFKLLRQVRVFKNNYV